MSAVRPSKVSVLWDAASTLGGWVLLFSQAGIVLEPPAEVSELLVIVAVGLIGSPSVTNLLALRFGATVPASSPPAGAVSSPPPSSSPGIGGS